MTKKKLLFVNGHLNVGGVEKSLADLLNNLDYHKYDVDLLLLEDKGTYLQQIPKEVNIIFFNTTKAYGPLLKSIFLNLFTLQWSMIWYRIILLITNKFGKTYLSILRYILPLKSVYNVAIAYRPGICADIVAYTVKSKKKIVWWHHGTINIDSSTILEYNKTWTYFNNVVTVSYGCKQLLAKTFQYPTNKIIVLPNIINTEQILKMAGTDSPYNNNKLKIISVGRLCPEKHFENIIYVTKRLIDDGRYDFHWYIIGDGELHEDLIKKINKYKINKHVTLLGKKNNPYPWIKYANIFVHPSYVESQGLVVLEAMTLGTPCVVCRSIGTSEFMINGVNGILTEPNELSLYTGLKQMININDRTILTSKAQIMVKEKFSKEHIIKTFNKTVVSNEKE